MRLSALLAEVAADVSGGADPVVRGLTYDSRRVAPGDLFVALRGELADGHDYLADAVRLGAVALLVEALPAGFEPGECATAQVDDTRRALAPVSAAFYGHPSRELRLLGITGTNGKTSTAFLVESILAAAGRRVGLIGTVEIRYHDTHQRTLNTTPESLDLQRTLRAMRTEGIDDVVMEVSSHGAALGRIGGCRFAVGAFTNLTQDHLDFHGTMDAYRAAKTGFFRDALAPGARAVVNADDAAAEDFADAARESGANLIWVSRDPARGADVTLRAADLGLDATRARLSIRGHEVETSLPLIGDFNLENLLVAAGVALAVDVSPDAIAAGAAACPQVPGRVERVPSDVPNAPTVLVDYAHTPDAVDKLLRTVRPLARGRLITVFGCGGDRDKSKRRPMAEAAARSSHCAIATSDNPRTEDPRRILEDVEVGLKSLRRVDPDELGADEGVYAVVLDRRDAIQRAVAIAAEDDIVVLAGKGHEDYQIVGRERLPFDDRLEARLALERRAAR